MKLVHTVAAALFALLGTATLLGAGNGFGMWCLASHIGQDLWSIDRCEWHVGSSNDTLPSYTI